MMAAAASNRRPTALVSARSCCAATRIAARAAARESRATRSRFPAQRGGAAPGRAPGAVAARQPKRPQTRDPAPAPGPAEERFAAPECAVRAEADAVPGEHEPAGRLQAGFGGERARVRTVVLHRVTGRPQRACPTRASRSQDARRRPRPRRARRRDAAGPRRPAANTARCADRPMSPICGETTARLLPAERDVVFRCPPTASSGTRTGEGSVISQGASPRPRRRPRMRRPNDAGTSESSAGRAIGRS